LERLAATGKRSAATMRRARILLKADAGRDGWADDRIAEALDTSTATVARGRKKFVQKGWRRPCSGSGRPAGRTANWTGRRKRGWPPWLVVRPRRARPAGP